MKDIEPAWHQEERRLQVRDVEPHLSFVSLGSVSEISCWFFCLIVAMYCLAGLYLALGVLPGHTGAASSPTMHQVSLNAVAADSKVVRPALDKTNEPQTSTGHGSVQIKAADAPDKVDPGSGQSFRDLTRTGQTCAYCPEMVVVPSGAFVLGAAAGEAWREDWQKALEGPPVQTTVAEPFAVGRFAVSFDEWEACARAAGCANRPSDNGWGRAGRPVINISWSEANRYVEWLSQKTGKNYRLLSEAEREYVTRAGTNTSFWFGNTPSPKRANYLWERTMPVDSMAPNAWGLFHVHGNVSEWTADCWNNSHQGHSGLAAARNKGDCKRRVVKGGSWFNGPSLLRSAARAGLNGDSRYTTVGLRVARTIKDRKSN